MLCTNVCLLSSEEVMSHFHPLILTGFYSTQGPSHLFLPRLQLSCEFMGGKKIMLHYSRWSWICTTLIIVNIKCASVFWSSFCPVCTLLCQYEHSIVDGFLHIQVSLDHCCHLLLYLRTT